MSLLKASRIVSKSVKDTADDVVGFFKKKGYKAVTSKQKVFSNSPPAYRPGNVKTATSGGKIIGQQSTTPLNENALNKLAQPATNVKKSFWSPTKKAIKATAPIAAAGGVIGGTAAGGAALWNYFKDVASRTPDFYQREAALDQAERAQNFYDEAGSGGSDILDDVFDKSDDARIAEANAAGKQSLVTGGVLVTAIVVGFLVFRKKRGK